MLPAVLDTAHACAYGEVERWLEASRQKGCTQSGDATIACDLTAASGSPAQIAWKLDSSPALLPGKTI